MEKLRVKVSIELLTTQVEFRKYLFHDRRFEDERSLEERINLFHTWMSLIYHHIDCQHWIIGYLMGSKNAYHTMWYNN